MSDLLRKIDATLRERLELTPCACGCGLHIGPRSNSPWFAEEACQKRFTARANNTRVSPPARSPYEDPGLPYGHLAIYDESPLRTDVPGQLDGPEIARWSHDAPVRDVWHPTDAELAQWRAIAETTGEGASWGYWDRDGNPVQVWPPVSSAEPSFFVRLIRRWREWLVILGGGAIAGLLVAVLSKLGWLQ